ncbi:TM2 domain-containing protein [Myroides pelagicus]|uniref:NINE protein n=1 Tax=Myroides pelagicus TaxID=270914 RepID=A0A7K1GM07_9FLAO|nr:NINE protein [Myroides pelagicus]MEC4113181.1 NINE protein [Myroides pelagicus]MTH29770.1 NINE protein [Myroides pelagicus]
MKSINEKYCSECGAVINAKAEICPRCGVRQPGVFNQQANEDKNRWLTAVLLCWFLGFLGVHRFYTGNTAIGIVQLLTLGGCGIWVIVDLILLVSGNYKDGEGNIIKNG